MFLGRVQPRGRGRGQGYWVLLESYRTAKGSRHRVVAYLGKLPAEEVSGWEKLAAHPDGKRPAGPGLFDLPSQGDAHEGCEDVAAVGLKNVRLQNIREFGQVYLARTLWRVLASAVSSENVNSFVLPRRPVCRGGAIFLGTGAAASLPGRRGFRRAGTRGAPRALARPFRPRVGRPFVSLCPQLINAVPKCSRLYAKADHIATHLALPTPAPHPQPRQPPVLFQVRVHRLHRRRTLLVHPLPFLRPHPPPPRGPAPRCWFASA